MDVFLIKERNMRAVINFLLAQVSLAMSFAQRLRYEPLKVAKCEQILRALEAFMRHSISLVFL